jgi:hypothetical protein
MDTLIGAFPYMWRFACTKVVRTTSRDFAPKDTPDLNSVTLHGKALTTLTCRNVRLRMLQAELLNRENRGCCSFFFWPGPRDPNFFSRAAPAGGHFWGSFLEPDFAPRRTLFAVGHTSRPRSRPSSSKISRCAPRSRRNSLDVGRDFGGSKWPSGARKPARIKFEPAKAATPPVFHNVRFNHTLIDLAKVENR